MSRTWAVLLALVPLAAAALTDEAALQLFNRTRGGDRAALEELQRAAGSGDAPAQFQLGRAFSHGSPILDRDDPAAAQWVEKAAQQGHLEAQSNMGYLYSAGLGVTADTAKTIAWWTRAAEGGFVPAQYNLALAYLQGKLTAKDDAKAFGWMSKAAAQGLPAAQASLGMMHLRGVGTAASMPEAAAWYRKAAAQGNEGSMMNLAIMLESGDGIPRDAAEALRWLRRPAANGNPRALALRAKICKSEAALCASEPLPEHFVFEMNDPRVRIVIPDAPPMTMEAHPLAPAQAGARYLGSGNPAYTISVLTPTADAGMSPLDCARSLTGSLARRWGLKRDDVVMRQTNERTIVLLFPVPVGPMVQLQAYLLSGEGGHCIEIHLSKMTKSPDDLAPWLKGFQNARIEAPR